MRINNIAIDGILEVSWEGRSKRLDDSFNFFECLCGPGIDRFRETRFDSTIGISSVVSGSETMVEVFHSGYQRGPFDVEGESIRLIFRMNQTNIFGVCPLSFMRRYKFLVKRYQNGRCRLMRDVLLLVQTDRPEPEAAVRRPRHQCQMPIRYRYLLYGQWHKLTRKYSFSFHPL